MPSTLTDAAPRHGVLLLAGYGIRVTVERGHLRVEDGVGSHRRVARFPRATRDLRRLVVLGHAGTISFDALRWLSDVGAGFAQIDSDGRVVAAAGPVSLDDARLRRAQARAVENGRALGLARELVREKLAGQRALLDRLPSGPEALPIVTAALGRIDAARTIEVLRATEAEAALAYWGAWAPVSVRFARPDAARIPAHWPTFGRRASLLTSNPRKATNPANAILNYLYALAEAEARLAALAVGCDPGLGVMHADQKSRDSLALDLMEPVRPSVDAWVLDLLDRRTFRRSDFFETRQGVCRLMPPLTGLLAQTAPRWAAAVAPHAEWIGRELLAQRGRGARPLPTPLTQDNRSAGRDGVRKGPRRRRASRAEPLGTCRVCGVEIERGPGQYCAGCRPGRSRETLAGARESLRVRRLAGDDPAHGGKAAQLRGRRNAAAQRANQAWERRQDRPVDQETFKKQILPGLRSVSLAAMMRATGLSQAYCAGIRRGVYTPHPRHWGKLRELLETDQSNSAVRA